MGTPLKRKTGRGAAAIADEVGFDARHTDAVHGGFTGSKRPNSPARRRGDRRTQLCARAEAQQERGRRTVTGGKRKTALAPLTAHGACGNCFNVLPLQEQSEIRSGKSLRRCEGCGIILYPAPETV